MIRKTGMSRTGLAAAAAVLLLCGGPAPATAQRPEGLVTDPSAVRLEVGDLRRLADVIRELRGGRTDTTALIREHYTARASPGLRAYLERYAVTPEMIVAAMARDPAAYADLDGLADAMLQQRPELERAFVRLQAIFPDAMFPPVWFIASHRGPGGLARSEGAIVAAEGFAGRADDIVPLVLHEVAHFQQAMLQGGETYQRIYGPRGTLLALVLREGSAEFIAWLTTGRHINPDAERWALPREARVWQRFREEMHGSATGDWMFGRPAFEGQPPDVGYWVGYRIVRSYYERAPDRLRAIREILALTDFEAFLRASGYEPRPPTGRHR
jgi:hypothetical protein